jgi:DNA-3-methyladenine glycosylase
MSIDNFQILPPEFYTQDTVSLAQSLLGKILVFESPKGLIAGKIVETEAYLQTDPSSHSFGGKTSRNSTMFEKAGTIYIYQIYGLYHCLNIVSNQKNIGEAVLIRALEPVLGIEKMQQNRQKNAKKQQEFNPEFNPNLATFENQNENLNKSFKKELSPILSKIPTHKLCNGPAKLMLAFGLNKTFNGHLIWQKPLFIAQFNPKLQSKLEPKLEPKPVKIVTTTRIGISKAKDLPLRFYLKDNPFVSKK